jgi:23S rRNA C2498 (ribose-2'-O)-methylase RlmM
LKVSKASQKIFEAINRWSVGGQIKDINTCLDIGASPGGWSYYMALELKACRVIAVDNGALATPKPPAVEHWKMKGEDAIDVLLANQLAANQLISIYTCDMNADPIVTVDLFLRAIPIMAVRGLVVLTLKRTIKNKEKWQMRKEECISKLHSELGERLIRLLEIHLIANTPNETTIMIQLG